MNPKIEKIKAMKGKEKISALTAYDYNTALIEDKAGMDIILVGDSLGMVILGKESTREVTMHDMLHHTQAVAKGCNKCLLVGDMPIHTYNSKEDAITNAKQFVEAGAESVKIENEPERIKNIVETGIPVMGHIGFTMQTKEKFKVEGNIDEEAQQLITLAKEIEAAGAYSLVLEAVSSPIAQKITKELRIPTIGIGSGIDCDGQILVVNDILGMFDAFTPKFVKKYAELNPIIVNAIKEYMQEVKQQKFPGKEHTYS